MGLLDLNVKTIFVFLYLQIVPAVVYIFYPVFYDLKLLSTFMYFEKRFHRSVRLVASLVFLFGATIFLPSVIYVPGIAFSQGKF